MAQLQATGLTAAATLLRSSIAFIPAEMKMESHKIYVEPDTLSGCEASSRRAQVNTGLMSENQGS
jgi:hypothetical protein